MSINYYVIGSTYDYTDKPRKDMFGHMVSRNVVSVGWAMHMNLNTLYGKPHEEIIDYLKNRGESTKSYSSLKRFLSLEPDDIIAVKKWNMKDGNGRIIVRAYARVVKRQGRIYGFDRTSLGHMINVEYIEKDVSIPFLFNYSQTIHHVTKPERIREIFGSVLRQVEFR